MRKSRAAKKAKYTKIGVLVAVILIVILAVTAYIVTLPQSPTKTYHVNDKVDDTGYYFAGLYYVGADNTQLSVYFKGVTVDNVTTAPEIILTLSSGNSTTLLIGGLPYKIVSYNLEKQTVSMIWLKNVVPA
jgi:hypothetical protein